MKKVLIPFALLTTLTLTACNNADDNQNGDKEKSETIVTTKAGKVTQTGLLNDLGKNKVAQMTFQSMMGDILREEFKKDLSLKDAEKNVDKNIEKLGGEETLSTNLKNQGLGTVENYKESQIDAQYNQILMNKTYKLSEKDIKDNVKKASHILIAVSDATSTSGDKSTQGLKNGLSESKAKEKANEILARIKKDPSNFEAIAKEESSDTQSAENGGSLDYVLKGQMDPTFEKELFKLKEGEVSGLVKTQYGYHIIRADKQTDFKERLDELKTKLIQRDSLKDPNKIKEEYKKLLKKYNVKYDDNDIKDIINNDLLSEKSNK